MPDKPILLTHQGEFDRLVASSYSLSSVPLGWQGLTLDYRCADGGTMPEIYASWHTIMFVCNTPHDPTLICSSGGKQWQEKTHPGDTGIIPAGVGYGVEWSAPIESLTLMLDPRFFATAIEAGQDHEQVEITTHFSLLDPLLYQLGLVLKNIVASDGTGQRLYAESLINTLMLHIQQHYTTHSAQPKVYSDGFSRSKLKLVLEYIQTNLDQDLGLKELASLLQISPYYFSHLFKQSTGIAPHQYVIRQRVERAKQLLKNPDLPIVEIAYQVGFANQAHLNRHFKRVVGVTPGAFRRG